MFKRILRSKWVWLGLLIVLGLILLEFYYDFTIRPKDVTFDPHYGFAPIAGTVWKTRAELAVIESDNLRLQQMGSLTRELYRKALADPKFRDGGQRVLAILPPGTRVRIERLVDIRGSLGLKIVHGSLLDSPFAGKDMTISDALFLENDITSPGRSLPRRWEVSPEFLEPP